MLVIGTDVIEQYLAARAGHRGMAVARKQYETWLAIAEASEWTQPSAIKKSHPNASILKASRVVFNIKGNDFRLICAVDYRSGLIMIRFFGSHAEYDQVDAETV